MHLPGPLRAAVGLVASAADEVKTLPDRAVELPMLAVSTALQVSLRAQQRYARLAARGERVLNRQEPGEEPPAWATFDDPLSVEDLQRAALAQLDSLIDSGAGADDESAGGGITGNGAGRMFEDLLGVDDPAAAVAGNADNSDTGDGDADANGRDATVVPISQAGRSARKSARKSSRKAPSKKAPAAKGTTATEPATKAPAKKAPVKKVAAETTSPASKTDAKKAPAKKAPAKKAPAKNAPVKKAAAKTGNAGKPVNKPRHTSPSRFDDAADD